MMYIFFLLFVLLYDYQFVLINFRQEFDIESFWFGSDHGTVRSLNALNAH